MPIGDGVQGVTLAAALQEKPFAVVRRWGCSALGRQRPGCPLRCSLCRPRLPPAAPPLLLPPACTCHLWSAFAQRSPARQQLSQRHARRHGSSQCCRAGVVGGWPAAALHSCAGFAASQPLHWLGAWLSLPPGRCCCRGLTALLVLQASACCCGCGLGAGHLREQLGWLQSRSNMRDVAEASVVACVPRVHTACVTVGVRSQEAPPTLAAASAACLNAPAAAFAAMCWLPAAEPQVQQPLSAGAAEAQWAAASVAGGWWLRSLHLSCRRPAASVQPDPVPALAPTVVTVMLTRHCGTSPRSLLQWRAHTLWLLSVSVSVGVLPRSGHHRGRRQADSGCDCNAWALPADSGCDCIAWALPDTPCIPAGTALERCNPPLAPGAARTPPRRWAAAWCSAAPPPPTCRRGPSACGAAPLPRLPPSRSPSREAARPPSRCLTRCWTSRPSRPPRSGGTSGSGGARANPLPERRVPLPPAQLRAPAAGTAAWAATSGAAPARTAAHRAGRAGRGRGAAAAPAPSPPKKRWAGGSCDWRCAEALRLSLHQLCCAAPLDIGSSARLHHSPGASKQNEV